VQNIKLAPSKMIPRKKTNWHHKEQNNNNKATQRFLTKNESQKNSMKSTLYSRKLVKIIIIYHIFLAMWTVDLKFHMKKLILSVLGPFSKKPY